MKRLYKYGGLAIIAIMVISPAVYALSQAYIFFPQQSTQQKTQLPNTNIIDYDLSTGQKTTLFQNGDTLLVYQYPQACSNCTQEKTLIEGFVTSSQFSGQLFLEELASAQNSSTLLITGNYGQDTLTNITQDSITNDLCKIVTQPPTFCALQQVK